MSVVPDGTRELDAFKLRSPLDPKQLHGRATCCCMHEDFVYLGLDSGLVASYSVEAKRPGMKDEQRRWNSVTHRQVGGLGTKLKSPIKQMQIIDPQATFSASGLHPPSHDLPLLFVLSEDGRLRALQQHTLEIVIDFNTVKDIDMFTVDLRPPHHVAIHNKLKRKLSLYSYAAINIMDASKNKHELIRELALNDLPLALSWYGDLIVAAHRNKYVLLNPTGGDIRETPVEVEGVQPCQAILGTNELLLTSKFELGIFVDFKGLPLPRNPITFGAAPFRIEHCDHFIIGLFNQEVSGPSSPSSAAHTQAPNPAMGAQFISVRIASLLDGRIVQTAPIPSPIASCANRDKLVLLTNSGDLFVLTLVSTEEQIAQYLDLSLTDEALKLFQRTNPDAKKLEEFHIQAAFVMLKDLLLMPAFMHLAQANIDPRELVAFFPDLVPADLPYDRKYKAHGVFEDFIEKGRKKAESRSEDKRYKAVVSMTAKQISRQCRLLLAQYLWDRRGKLDSEDEPTLVSTIDTALLILCIEFADDPTITTSSVNTVTGANKALAIIFSTSHFPFTLQQLLFPSNHVIVSEAENYLLSHHHYQSLALLYQSFHEPRKALEVWHRMGEGEFSERNRPSQQSVNEGIQQTVIMLQSLGDSPLLWEFAEWVLLKDSVAGLKIFTQHSHSKPISHEKVLAYLRKVNSKKPVIDTVTGADDDKRRDSVEVYLEYIVLSGDNRDPIYHTQLAINYVNQVHILQAQSITDGTINTACGSSELPVKSSYRQRPKPGLEAAPLGPLRAKLYHFLQTSSYYDTEQVLQQLLLLVWPRDQYPRSDTLLNPANDALWLPSPPVIAATNIGMIEEMILMLAKLNFHFKVLHLFVYGLGDQNGAAYYCLHVTKVFAKKMSEDTLVRVQALNRLKEKQRAAANDISSSIAGASNPFSDDSGSRRKPSSASVTRSESDSDDDSVDDSDFSHHSADDALAALDDTPHPGDVFLSLADIYFSDDYFQLFSTADELAIPPGSTPPSSVYRSAVQLLNLYANYMDPVKVVRVIPEYVPLPALQPLFARLVPRCYHDRRHAQIINMLAKTEHLSYQCQAMKAKSQYYEILEDDKCVHCNKLIGEAFFCAVRVEFGQVDYERGIQPEVAARDEEEPLSPSSPPPGPVKEKKGVPRTVLLHQACLHNYQLRHNRR